MSKILKSLGHNVLTMGHMSKTEVDIRCDLLNLDLLRKELYTCFETVGAIDILICNAGSGRLPIENLGKADLEQYFIEKNFQTSQNLLFAATPYLRTPGCSIIGISSIAALTDNSGAPEGYSKSKRMMNKLFTDTAIHMAQKGIRANVISPGNIYFEGSRWDEISNDKPDYVSEILNKKVPLHRFINPIEIVDSILFLSSSSAVNITGINLIIDGGQVL